ncbi:MAG: hypothetical protein JO036_17360 [Candidatus Eremiobacteraeota bacterium]|nr:hypothetical protein [Candidatus Eremiobacteraeota bacterium]
MTSGFARSAGLFAAAAALLVFAGCGGGGGGSAPVPQAMQSAQAGDTTMMTQVRVPAGMQSMDADFNDEHEDGGAVLPRLVKQTTIGSTVDPLNGDQNPYGLDVAPVSAGLLHKGDLVVCNFNDAANVQGNGTTIVALSPHAGANPVHVDQNAGLLGCDALALGPTDNIWTADFGANDNAIVSPSGTFLTGIPGGPWHHPFGQAFSPRNGPFGNGAFYVSNAGDGSIVRVNLTAPGFTFDVIATGFAVNGGAPGSILGPSGLEYDAQHDRLWIVDGADNSLTALQFVSFIPAGGVVAHPNGTFTGPARKLAHRVFHGAPLNGPISAALLPGGHLALGNTLDPNGTNLIVEITPRGRVVATKNVDAGNGAAIFGMVATGNDDNVKLYYNNDNDNTLRVLTR